VIVRFDVDALTARFAALTGDAPQTLRFEGATDGGSAESARLRRIIEFLIAEIDAAGGETAHPHIAELEQLMMLQFLHASAHTHRDVLERGPARAAPWQVRRAEDYICANLDKALTVEAIAEATGASARAIFKAFNESRGYSPMVFAKMQRLERARALLRAGAPGTTVTGVALACGFLHQGHFARDYRARFGELPSQTLRNAR
jgi:transcriptional regulator GlxA family with amidase domain